MYNSKPSEHYINSSLLSISFDFKTSLCSIGWRLRVNNIYVIIAYHHIISYSCTVATVLTLHREKSILYTSGHGYQKSFLLQILCSHQIICFSALSSQTDMENVRDDVQSLFCKEIRKERPGVLHSSSAKLLPLQMHSHSKVPSTAQQRCSTRLACQSFSDNGCSWHSVPVDSHRGSPALGAQTVSAMETMTGREGSTFSSPGDISTCSPEHSLDEWQTAGVS